MPLRLPCRNALRKRVAEHVAVPSQALEKACRSEDVAGARQGLGDLWRHGRRRISISEPAYLDRVASAELAHVRKVAIAEFKRAGAGVEERGDVLKQWTCALKQRRGVTHG